MEKKKRLTDRQSIATDMSEHSREVLAALERLRVARQRLSVWRKKLRAAKMTYRRQGKLGPAPRVVEAQEAFDALREDVMFARDRLRIARYETYCAAMKKVKDDGVKYERDKIIAGGTGAHVRLLTGDVTDESGWNGPPQSDWDSMTPTARDMTFRGTRWGAGRGMVDWGASTPAKAVIGAPQSEIMWNKSHG